MGGAGLRGKIRKSVGYLLSLRCLMGTEQSRSLRG